MQDGDQLFDHLACLGVGIQHDDHGVAAEDLPEPVDCPGALGREGVHRLAPHVPGFQPEARPQQVDRHRLAHHAQPHESDPMH